MLLEFLMPIIIEAIILLLIIHTIVLTALFWFILQYWFKKKLKKSSILSLFGVLLISNISGITFSSLLGLDLFVGGLFSLTITGVILFKRFSLTDKQVVILVLIDALTMVTIFGYYFRNFIF